MMKIGAVLICLAAVFFSGCGGCGDVPGKGAESITKDSAKGKKILIVVSQKDFQQVEYNAVDSVFKKAGADITLASLKTEEAAAMDGKLKIKPDKALKDCKGSDYDAVIFIGGMGVPALYDDSDAQRIANEAFKAGKITSAICLAPGILAKAGLLEGKKASCYKHETSEKAFKAGGAEFADSPVTKDGIIITGKDPDAAPKFTEAVWKAVIGK